MPFTEHLSPSLIESNNKTERGYTILLSTQILTIVYTIVVFQIILRSTSPAASIGYTFGFSIVGLAYTWFTYAMIRHFSQSKIVIRATLLIFVVSFWTGLIIANPLDPMDMASPLYKILGIVNQIGSLLAFSIIMVFMVRDIY